MTPALAATLADWRQRCEAEATRLGVSIRPDAFIASTWPDCSRPVNVNTLTATVSRVCGQDLDVHLHSLRHNAATELLANGVSPADVARLLGHADGGQLALRVYGHAREDRQQMAAGVLERLLPAAVARDALVAGDS